MEGFTLGFLFGGAVTLIILGCTSDGPTESDAVEAGVAEWYLDENHEKQFQFITPEQSDTGEDSIIP